MKLILAGGGAFGTKHLNGLKNIDDVEVVSLVGRRLEPTQKMADEFGVPLIGTSIVFQLYRALQRQGLGGEGNHALVKALENLSGLEIGQYQTMV